MPLIILCYLDGPGITGPMAMESQTRMETQKVPTTAEC
ncbi:MAG: hypothetical protein Ct9H300mP9_4070 [Candidatus Neomarinimicrobiota bacterium]|nr:MAG: hypothetical protein Ct9H300mP9_4070 [Candidatus Neomarinimicrobiota bacterium]